MKDLGTTRDAIIAAAPPAIAAWVRADDPAVYEYDTTHWLAETLDDVDEILAINKAGADSEFVCFEFVALVDEGEYVLLSVPQDAAYFVPRALADARPAVRTEYNKVGG